MYLKSFIYINTIYILYIQETCSYFSLPFCAGPKESISHYHETLGEALQGTELEFSGLDIDYKSEFALGYVNFCVHARVLFQAYRGWVVAQW